MSITNGTSRDVIELGVFAAEPEKGWFQACYVWNCKPGSFRSRIRGPRKITQNIPHNSVTQVRNLTMEITCLVWAGVLLNLVYKFIDKGITSHGVPPFQIPRMRFVEASLAIERVTSEFDEARAFLLEEVIGGDEGHFRKYLNNVSDAPVSFTNKDDEERAEFLAFSQHVQYFKTKKMAFVAD